MSTLSTCQNNKTYYKKETYYYFFVIWVIKINTKKVEQYKENFPTYLVFSILA